MRERKRIGTEREGERGRSRVKKGERGWERARKRERWGG